ncbi:chemotaxis protein CheB [Phaeobacter sp. HF9A]|uniref:chemotaxis protein CheB n=1 Tax=Phaeobacter sp. HF9A TaxID=2721561 RepID=UPI00142FF936|nr:chemotaxis protein CheB [Phaeobacter sp. HF9A]NIZ14747.1 chemotaxis protein CheR [Phaeobacter sp. HF9A]
MAEAQPPFLIGIAASAGGLEALGQLVRTLPQRANASYIIAQHLSADHKSLLCPLIAQETELPVVELTEAEVAPQADTIYIVPPGFDVILETGQIALRAPSSAPGTPKPLADRLFRSLAEGCGARSLGIVLSGTGSDGSDGLRAIHSAGGITLAQAPDTAKYDSMPASAIQTGCVDLSLPPDMIGQQLMRILSNPGDLADLQAPAPSDRLRDLYALLLDHSGVDFRDYRENTINRRIARRMLRLGITQERDYLALCHRNHSEIDALYRDLMISVTRFFRDPAPFRQLAKAIRSLVEHHPNGQIRVWVAGCATGEEAYSVAMLFADAMGGLAHLRKERLQIFATDTDAKALEVARRGVYPLTAANDVPRPYVEDYLRVGRETLEVDKRLRAVVLFSRHNIIQDPPFINLNLISLRNLLIYFGSALQEKVLSRMAYALMPNGKLFLGASETVGAMQGHFETQSLPAKLYSKRGLRQTMRPPPHSGPLTPSLRPPHRPARPAADAPQQDMFETLTRILAPNGFITTRDAEIIRILGDISHVTELNESSALQRMSTKILKSTLRAEAASLITLCLRSRTKRVGRWHDIRGYGFDQVRLICYPLLTDGEGEDHALFAVETRKKQPRLLLTPPEMSDQSRRAYVRQIEEEIAATREALHHTIAELQSSNEEMQSVNEEMQATNEELQASNEELETSNEELRSTNEELIAVNEHMQRNATALQQLSLELAAILKATPYPTLVVDPALHIRHASAAAQRYFDLGDLPREGTPLSACRTTDGQPQMAPEVTRSLRSRERETVSFSEDGREKTMAFTPIFKGREQQIIGTIVSVI